MSPFAERLLRWFDVHGRHDLPWQHPREPYRVWLSEIMLQQTQVTTVIPYFERFLRRFPDLATLAAAPADDVLAHWAGLGYYARARNLHRCAQTLIHEHGGAWPRDIDTMASLPGIGRSTAGAILAQAYGDRHAILDGNVRRVLSRHAAVAGWPGAPTVQKRLWREAEQRLPDSRLADYTQALMDLGAGLCSARAPKCPLCPVAEDCIARRSDTVAQYPAPKPARQRPRRSTRMLIVVDAGGRLLLERRPPSGLWGGLWCTPLLGDTDPATDDWLRTCGLVGAAVETLPAFSHTFTHFDLQLHPQRVRAHAAPLVAENRWQWIDTDQLARLGLPAPIRRMLDSLTTDTPP